MKLIYIVGPFRAKCMYEIEQNIRLAEAVSLDLWKMGYVVICPHTNTRFFDGAVDDNVFLNGYLEILSRCDACFCVGDWEKSSGSLAEVRFAKEKNIPVFVDKEDLVISEKKTNTNEIKIGAPVWVYLPGSGNIAGKVTGMTGFGICDVALLAGPKKFNQQLTIEISKLTIRKEVI